MASMSINLNVDDLAKLLGVHNGELPVTVKNHIVQEFAKRYLKGAVDEAVITPILEQHKKMLSETIKQETYKALGTPTTRDVRNGEIRMALGALPPDLRDEIEHSTKEAFRKELQLALTEMVKITLEDPEYRKHVQAFIRVTADEVMKSLAKTMTETALHDAMKAVLAKEGE